jgi:hypothetical protein
VTWNVLRAGKTTCKQLRSWQDRLCDSRNWLHETCSPYKGKCVDWGSSYWDRNTAKCRRECRIFHSLQLRLLSLLDWNIVYLFYAFYFNVDIVSWFWTNFNSFNLLNLLLTLTGYFQRVTFPPT